MANPDRPSPAGDAAPTIKTGAEKWILACAGLAWLGLSIAILLVQRHAGLPSLFCPAQADCDAVLTSKYAAFMGIPLPWMGVGVYSLLLVLALFAFSSPSAKTRVRFTSAILWLSVMGASFSAVLMFLQFGVLRAFCPLCTASAVVMLTLAVVSAIAEGRAADPAFTGRPASAIALFVFAVIPAIVQLLPREGATAEVLASVNGQKFTRQQMNDEIGSALQPAEQALFTTQFEWVRKKVDAALLAAESARTNSDAAAELAGRVAATKPPEQAEVTKRLAATALPETAQNVERVRTELLEEARAQVRAAFMEEIAARHRVEMFLAQPPVRELKIDLATAHVSGRRDAPVQLVVFSDFECHFCRELAGVLQRVRREFPDQVMVAYRHFPVESHARALPAAIAAECAAEQGAFWEFHDRLHTGSLSDEHLNAIAGELKLDVPKFAECRNSDRPRKIVERSRADAVANGLAGTPSLFLNGRLIGGMISYENLVAKIRAALTGGNTAEPKDQ